MRSFLEAARRGEGRGEGPESKRADLLGPLVSLSAGPGSKKSRFRGAHSSASRPSTSARHRVWGGGGIKEPPSQRRERLLPPKILILSIDQTAAQAQALTSLLLRGIPNRPAGSPASSA